MEGSMRRLLCSLAVLPLLAGVAAAQPLQLTDRQMDRVAGGFFEIDRSNTSVTILSIFQRPYLLDSTGNTLSCPTCYLLIVTPTISIGSQFGP
jgi:hypothetical protein